MRFKVITFVSDEQSWINPYIKDYIEHLRPQVDKIYWCHDLQSLPSTSDITFYLSFSKIVAKELLERSKHNLVVHESKLPKGKGWSPLTWQVLEGKKEIPITLFEADEKVDNGKIYLQDTVVLAGHELVDELRAKQAYASFKLCQAFIDDYEQVVLHAYVQEGEESFYAKRTPKDSRLDLHKPLLEQINLLRVVDNEKYPAYFEYLGHIYHVKIYKQS